VIVGLDSPLVSSSAKMAEDESIARLAQIHEKT
jgi:hypothetical protein